MIYVSFIILLNIVYIEYIILIQRNIEAVINELQRLNIKIISNDTGDTYGRTLVFDPQNGIVTVKSFLHGNKTI